MPLRVDATTNEGGPQPTRDEYIRVWLGGVTLPGTLSRLKRAKSAGPHSNSRRTSPYPAGPRDCVQWPEPPSRSGPCRKPAPVAPSPAPATASYPFTSLLLTGLTQRQSVPVTAPTHGYVKGGILAPRIMTVDDATFPSPLRPAPRRASGQPCRASQQLHRFCAGFHPRV